MYVTKDSLPRGRHYCFRGEIRPEFARPADASSAENIAQKHRDPRLRLLGVLLFFIALAVPPVRAGDLLDISGLAQLAAEKAKEAKGATLLSLDYEFAGAIYLPVWVLHSGPAAQAPADYFEAGIGGELREGGEIRPFLSVGANLPAISGWLWRSQWAQDHLRRTKLPPIWVGPFVRVPLPGRAWVIGREIGGIVAIQLGGSK